jgi:hypothetical protein
VKEDDVSKTYSHYGLEFVLDHAEAEVEDVARKLEAHRNRERKLRAKSMRQLQDEFKKEFGTAFGKCIEREMDRRFRCLYRLRMKG